MKKSAFTIIELSIVLVVITILVSGIVGGASMIKAARLAHVRSVTLNSQIAKIPGLIAWYETSLKESFATSQNYEGAQLSAWNDISPESLINQKNILTKTANSNVVFKEDGINKTPSIYFNGSDKFEITSLYQGTTNQITVFLVLKPEYNPTSTQVIPFDASVGNDRFSLGIKATALQIDAGNSAITSTATNPADFENSINYIICAYFDLANSKAFVNDISNMIGNAQVDDGSNALTGLSIGADKNTSSGFTGLISEVIIYNRPLKIDERRDVMSYLSEKYKINVSGL